MTNEVAASVGNYGPAWGDPIYIPPPPPRSCDCWWRDPMPAATIPHPVPSYAEASNPPHSSGGPASSGPENPWVTFFKIEAYHALVFLGMGVFGAKFGDDNPVADPVDAPPPPGGRWEETIQGVCILGRMVSCERPPIFGEEMLPRTKFQQLTGRPPAGSVDVAKQPDGTYITYRSTSSSGTPAISVNNPGVSYETIHFQP